MPEFNWLDTRKFTPEQLLLTTDEAGEILRISRTTVYGLIKAGSLRPVRIGRSCRISLLTKIFTGSSSQLAPTGH